MDTAINVRQIAFGLLALLAGTLVYVFARPGGAVFLPDCLILCAHPPPPAWLWGPFPAFAHTAGICLLMAGVLSAGQKAGIWICVSWTPVEAAFEVGQHPWIGPRISTHLPLWIDHIPILKLTRGFFLRGSFDPFDLAAIFMGAAFAYLVIMKINRERKNHENCLHE